MFCGCVTNKYLFTLTRASVAAQRNNFAKVQFGERMSLLGLIRGTWWEFTYGNEGDLPNIYITAKSSLSWMTSWKQQNGVPPSFIFTSSTCSCVSQDHMDLRDRRERWVASFLGEYLTVLPLLLLLGRVRSPITTIVDQDIIICLTCVFAMTSEPGLSLPGGGGRVIHRGKGMFHQLPMLSCYSHGWAE